MKSIELKNIIIQGLKEFVPRLNNAQNFDFKFKRFLGRKYQVPPVANSLILKVYTDLVKAREIINNQAIKKELVKRPIRSLSGVSVVTVLTKPYPCPGQCIFCPLESGMPKSYLDGEPAASRAKLLKFNPYTMVRSRIETLESNGHPVDKIELIVIGGTWSFLPKHYQTWFIKNCFAGANATPREKVRQMTLEKLQKINETSKSRVVGLTLETRPDFITPQEIARMRSLGTTRVELGAQILNDRILALNRRGHGIDALAAATRLLRNAGFKICYHMMPGLYGATTEDDIASFRLLFNDERFQPDMIKIYPTVVIKNTYLYHLWEKGDYVPYDDDDLIKLTLELKKMVPEYTRINRLYRDVPSTKVEAGCIISNMREVLATRMKKLGIHCRCIRCREARALDISSIAQPELKIQKYATDGGEEYFLTYEIEDLSRDNFSSRNCHISSEARSDDEAVSRRKIQQGGATKPQLKYDDCSRKGYFARGLNNKLLALLRLRIPARYNETNEMTKVFPELKDAAIIREVHTYGQEINIGESNDARRSASLIAPLSGAHQHKGFGKKLIQKAEKIACERGFKKMAVIAGIGTREYYRKQGYERERLYMTKKLKMEK